MSLGPCGGVCFWFRRFVELSPSGMTHDYDPDESLNVPDMKQCCPMQTLMPQYSSRTVVCRGHPVFQNQQYTQFYRQQF